MENLVGESSEWTHTLGTTKRMYGGGTAGGQEG